MAELQQQEHVMSTVDMHMYKAKLKKKAKISGNPTHADGGGEGGGDE